MQSYGIEHIYTNEPKHSAEKIKMFLREMPWLFEFLKGTFCTHLKNRSPEDHIPEKIENIRIARVSSELMELQNHFDDYISVRNRREIETNNKSFIFFFDDQGMQLPFMVGSRWKWRLTHIPRFFGLIGRYKIDLKAINFPETVKGALRRSKGSGITDPRYILHMAKEKTNDHIKTITNGYKIVIYRVPKGYTLKEWLIKDKEMMRESIRKEVIAEA